MEIINEHRLDSEQAIESAHEAAIRAVKQTHKAQLYEVQKLQTTLFKMPKMKWS